MDAVDRPGRSLSHGVAGVVVVVHGPGWTHEGTHTHSGQVTRISIIIVIREMINH